MLSAAAVAAALCSVAVAASTAGVVVHHPEGFGPHGRLATIGGLAWPSGSEQTAVTGDGRIYVAAVPGPSGAPEAVRVRRYLPDGKPDRSFGIAGSVIPSELGSGFRLDELLVDANGLPYLVGTTGDGEQVVARLAPSGAPDLTYGDDGEVRLGSLPSGAARPRATIDQSNRVVVAAAGAVERLNPDGTLDSTFGTDGAVPLPDPDVKGLGVDEEGRVQLAFPDDEGRGFRLMRLDQYGRPNMRTVKGIGAVRAMAIRSGSSTLILGSAPWVPGQPAAFLLHANGDDYLVDNREIIDLDIHPHTPFCPGDTVVLFGRKGRIRLASPDELVARGASITDGGGTLLVDGIARARPGSPAHGFLAKFPAAEHIITYAPEAPRPEKSRCGF